MWGAVLNGTQTTFSFISSDFSRSGRLLIELIEYTSLRSSSLHTLQVHTV